ncbi:hypothetical protein KOI35_32210 [Actinoplanes bogorensis]|uniref:Uncharacterized protein n=1 Tax=Paractinoplanes bogorensis TaxID=1610840 RepID=A0ABS5YXM7_9ACTN|nr:hypothetical protein [Actinoplanes bogorensis]MBU2668186.1 hypothetical protein [Actinoplanes bogorensis]
MIADNRATSGMAAGAPLRSAEDDREDPERPESAAFLSEDDRSWAEKQQQQPADDYVPVVRPDEEDDDMSGWDDADASWLTAADNR